MKGKIEKTINEMLGVSGRILSASKSAYRRIYPNNLVVFNSNIFIHSKIFSGKIWFGDIDLTKEHELLMNIAMECDIDIYVLSEMDGRFDKDGNMEFKEDAIWSSKFGLNEKYWLYVEQKTLKLK